MKAIIMAAGIGKRLQPYSNIIPKPLMPIGLKKGGFLTIIEKIIDQLKIASIKEIIVVVNYKKELIKQYLGNGSSYNVKLKYVFQEKLDGNGGAIFRCQHLINEEVLFVDADNYVEDNEIFLKLRKSFEKGGVSAVVGVKKVDDIKRYAIFKIKKGKIVDIKEKPSNKKIWGDVAKSGFAIISKKIIKMDKKISRTNSGEYSTTQLFKHLLKKELPVKLFYIKGDYEDIGSWNSYQRVLRKNI